MINTRLILAVFALGSCFTPIFATGSDRPLRAGAARVEITPAPDAALPMSGYASRKQGSTKIHDSIYVRAIVLDDGIARAAIVVWELIGVPNVVRDELAPRIERETGIPANNVLIAGVHTHSAPSLRSGSVESGPGTAAYTAKVQDLALDAVRRAQANLQPARVGAGRGTAYVNVNRRERVPGRGTALGYNPDGPSDKTLSVVKFETADAKPIALLINYPVHAVVMGPANLEISGDIAGATSRFVERHYAGEQPGRSRSDAGHGLNRPISGTAPVVIWTSGAAGDQNPIALARASDFTMVDGLGRLMGEEAVRVAERIRTAPKGNVHSAQRVVTCPGQKFADGKFEDADPQNIRLSLLTFGSIALAGISGEVLTGIGQRLVRESPIAHSIVVTHVNGSSGYIPDDAAYDQVSYEITSSRIKRACAENAIVNGFLEMIEQR